MSVYHSEDMGKSNKDDGSPLTRADSAAHTVICNELAALTPDIPIVSEEDSTTRERCTGVGIYWLVDPLDGTKEFINRNGEFTVNIALILDGMPHWGVVYAPALRELFWGGRTFGAWRRCALGERAIRVARPDPESRTLRVVASKSHMNEATTEFINRLGPTELVQAGSSLKLCRVAEGIADLYPRLGPTCEWDTAAAHAVVEGAGGTVTDLHGDSLRYGKQDILNPHFVVSGMRLPLPATIA